MELKEPIKTPPFASVYVNRHRQWLLASFKFIINRYRLCWEKRVRRISLNCKEKVGKNECQSMEQIFTSNPWGFAERRGTHLCLLLSFSFCCCPLITDWQLIDIKEPSGDYCFIMFAKQNEHNCTMSPFRGVKYNYCTQHCPTILFRSVWLTIPFLLLLLLLLLLRVLLGWLIKFSIAANVINTS